MARSVAILASCLAAELGRAHAHGAKVQHYAPKSALYRLQEIEKWTRIVLGLTRGRILSRRKQKLRAFRFIVRGYGGIGRRWEMGAWSVFFCREDEAARRSLIQSTVVYTCNSVACIREACCRLSVGSIAVRSAVEKPHKFITKPRPRRERSGVGWLI